MNSKVIAILSVCLVLPALLLAAPAADLGRVVVYPNPFEPALGHTAVTFDNLTDSVRLRVFRLNGELVYDEIFTAVNGAASWNVINTQGEPLATGTYIFLITNDGGKKTAGKLLVVR